MPGKNGKEIDNKQYIFFFYASKCSNQSLWHFAGKGTGLPKGGPKGVA
jgi:hypothetical protein